VFVDLKVCGLDGWWVFVIACAHTGDLDVCLLSAMPNVIKNAKIALLDIDLRKSKLAFGIQVLVDDPKKLEDIRKKCVIVCSLGAPTKPMNQPCPLYCRFRL